MVFGGGVEYDTGRLAVALEGRYDLGLVSLTARSPR
jgi:hypothetical protein